MFFFPDCRMLTKRTIQLEFNFSLKKINGYKQSGKMVIITGINLNSCLLMFLLRNIPQIYMIREKKLPFLFPSCFYI